MANTQDAAAPDSALRQGLNAFLRDRTAVIGLLVLVAAVAAAVLAPLLTPYDPTLGDEDAILAPPLTAGHLLGTDAQGRGLLSPRRSCRWRPPPRPGWRSA
jgi:ABC-type dipeptide/oligopeptide/nickel transport system permease subunit